MLPATSNQLSAALNGGQFDVQVLLEDAQGNWVDLTALLGTDWTLSVEWNADVDEPVSGATITLAKTDGHRSLSPLVTDDQVNASFGDLIRAPARAKLIIDGTEAAYWLVTEYSVNESTVTLHAGDYFPALLA